MTTYVLDATTRHWATTADVVIGGSPLRLFRLSDAGVALFDEIAAGDDITPTARRPARRPAASTPAPSTRARRAARFTPADVTVVVPAFVLGESALAEIVRCCAGVAGVIAVDDASEPAGGRRSPGRGCCGCAPTPVRPSPATPASAPSTRRSSPSSTPTCASSRAGSSRCSATSPTSASALVAPRVASAPGAGPIGGRLRAGALPARPRPASRAASPRAPGSATCPAAAIVVRTQRASGRSTASIAALRFGEDVDAVWRLVEAGWRCRYEPASVVHHRPRRRGGRSSPSASPTARRRAPLSRRHPAPLAPVRISGWSGGAWALLAAGQPIPALAVAGGTTLALIRKLPGVPAGESLRLAGARPPPRRAAARRRRPPGVVAAAARRRRRRRSGCAGCGRRRRGAGACCRAGSPKLVDDLAYGAGLWKGVIADRETGRPAAPASRRGPVAPPRPERADRRLVPSSRRDAAPDRRHRRLAGPRRPRRPRLPGPACRS